MKKSLFAGATLTALFSGHALANEPLTLVLDWYINPDHAPIMVAEQIGAFKAQGLDVRIIPPSDPVSYTHLDVYKRQTYGYAGHQLILQARQMIADGLLGDIRIVNMQFAHGFHAQPVEQENASTRWRVDPRFVGPSYVLGDLATHPLFLVETMAPQLKITRLMCARQSFVKSRAPLEDNAHVLMEYDNGAIGSLWSSAVNCGSMHGQKVRIIGEKASLEWWDEQPNQLRYEIQGEPVRILERGMDYLDPLARQDDRIGGGHPEGLFEAWSNLYRRFAIAMDAADRRDEALLADFWYPDARAGAFGVRWVENCVRSADNGACWVDFR